MHILDVLWSSFCTVRGDFTLFLLLPHIFSAPFPKYHVLNRKAKAKKKIKQNRIAALVWMRQTDNQIVSRGAKCSPVTVQGNYCWHFRAKQETQFFCSVLVTHSLNLTLPAQNVLLFTHTQTERKADIFCHLTLVFSSHAQTDRQKQFPFSALHYLHQN